MVATVSSHIRAFHLPFAKWLISSGYRVEFACACDQDLSVDIPTWEIPFSRDPLSPRNIRAFFLLLKLLQSRRYDLVHVHTPVAAFLARVACRLTGTPVIYTVHGFHWYYGAPLVSRIVYKTVECALSRWTDGMIVMNDEDLGAALEFGLVLGTNVFLTHGVGVDINHYTPNQTVCSHSHRPTVLCLGEFTPNKNHQLLVRAWEAVARQTQGSAQLLLAGEGPCKKKVKQEVTRRGLAKTINVLGFCSDVPGLLGVSDIVVLSSYREGLPRSIMEAMCASKPVVATDVRGSRDLVVHGVTGLLVPPNEPAALAGAILYLLSHPDEATAMGREGRRRIEDYGLDGVLTEMSSIYRRYLGNP